MDVVTNTICAGEALFTYPTLNQRLAQNYVPFVDVTDAPLVAPTGKDAEHQAKTKKCLQLAGDKTSSAAVDLATLVPDPAAIDAK
jgi:ethanolamine utilization microcompartment shell protein EutS